MSEYDEYRREQAEYEEEKERAEMSALDRTLHLIRSGLREVANEINVENGWASDFCKNLVAESSAGHRELLTLRSRIEDLEMMLRVVVDHRMGFMRVRKGEIWHRNTTNSPNPWRISFGSMRPVDVPDEGGLPSLTPEARAAIRQEADGQL